MTYLDISRKLKDTWRFYPPSSQTRGFVFPRKGILKIGGSTVDHHVLGLFTEGEETIEIIAVEEADFIVALVAPSPYPILHEYGQMHTNKEALERSKIRIQEIGAELKANNII